jgi:hypothetical protein
MSDCRTQRSIRPAALAAVSLAAMILIPAMGQTPCVVPDNGGGTIDLPPPGCGYVSPADLHRMIDGLPAGSEIRISAQHSDFFNVTRGPGGTLGGEVENFDSFLFLNLQGTGALGFYTRSLNLQVTSETHVAPHAPGPLQSFATEMFALQGQLPLGDPDFDLLRITAGSGFGMPSPGHTTLTQQPGGDWNVDSFFDITYRIDFIGAPGGPFAGMSGSTTGTIRMQAGTPGPNPPPCVVADDGSGTVSLPPPGCDYVSPAELHKMIDGLPPGVEIHISAQHGRFFGVTSLPGGTLGGEREVFGSELKLNLTGAGLNRTLTLPVNCETHIGPRDPGTSPQSFDNLMWSLQGQLPPGDPDFDLLRITAGNQFGMPSPGHTTLTQLPGGSWNVDSFFDITYRIEFIGSPGGGLAGMSGSTTATIKMHAGQPRTTLPTCLNPDNGSGTVDLPPAAGCGYLSPDDVHAILDGLPPGTEVNLGAQHARFFNVVRTPGGSLGGEIETFNSLLSLNLQGQGILPGFSRILTLPVQCETHTGPRTPGVSPQTFPNDMFRLQGQLPAGDPDFDLLRIQGGTFFGMPSPGHTTLTLQGGTQWAVDSFFDITYRIDFVGSPGGHLGGMSGSTTGTIRMAATPEVMPPAGQPGLLVDGFPSASLMAWSAVPGATGYDVVCGDLQMLRSTGGDFAAATTRCQENDQPSNAAPDASTPQSGMGEWCLVRAVNVVGFSSYGGPARDGGILGSGLGCP